MDGLRVTGSTDAIEDDGKRINGSGLTERQMEVAALVVEGLSNAEIGARLFLSPATVKNHITAIGNKLGIEKRETGRRYVRLEVMRWWFSPNGTNDQRMEVKDG